MLKLQRVVSPNVDDPYWITPAYEKTQKKAVLAPYVYEDETELLRDQKKRRRMPEQPKEPDANKAK
jgi:hypothetical protein